MVIWSSPVLRAWWAGLGGLKPSCPSLWSEPSVPGGCTYVRLSGSSRWRAEEVNPGVAFRGSRADWRGPSQVGRSRRTERKEGDPMWLIREGLAEGPDTGGAGQRSDLSGSRGRGLAEGADPRGLIQGAERRWSIRGGRDEGADPSGLIRVGWAVGAGRRKPVRGGQSGGKKQSAGASRREPV